MTRIGPKQAFRAIYWLAAVWLLYSGIKGLVGLFDLPANPTIVKASLEEFALWLIAIILFFVVWSFLTLLAGVLLLPPVIDRMWAGRTFFGRRTYRAFGALVIMLPPVLAFAVFAKFAFSDDPRVMQRAMQALSTNLINLIFSISLGLMFFPFSAKYIRKGGEPEEAQGAAMERGEA